MVEIKCLVCEETVELPSFINSDDYDGEFVCQNCKSRMHVKLLESKVKRYKVVEKGSTSRLEELLEDLKKIGEKPKGV